MQNLEEPQAKSEGAILFPFNLVLPIHAVFVNKQLWGQTWWESYLFFICTDFDSNKRLIFKRKQLRASKKDLEVIPLWNCASGLQSY